MFVFLKHHAGLDATNRLTTIFQAQHFSLSFNYDLSLLVQHHHLFFLHSYLLILKQNEPFSLQYVLSTSNYNNIKFLCITILRVMISKSSMNCNTTLCLIISCLCGDVFTIRHVCKSAWCTACCHVKL